MTTPKTIDALYAWIATEPDGGEGICGWNFGGDIGWLPLIGADMARIESLRPQAKMVAAAKSVAVRLVMFDRRTVLEDKP